MKATSTLTLFLFALLKLGSASADPLLTKAEKTNFRQTGRYAEARKLCEAYSKQWPGFVRVETFGTSPEGRELMGLVVTKSGARSPETSRSQNVPVVFVQACIHAGEVCGKDAGFMALRELLHEDSSFLERVVVVFVPILNVDGHERFARWNRPNQTGPEEMGWRVTSRNLNLNRDYTKTDCSEMRDLLRYMGRWDPILYIDLHSTDGARFQCDVSVIVEPILLGSKALHESGNQLLKETLDSLRERGSLPVSFYPSLSDSNDPMSGFANGAFGPRYSTGYWPLRNRLSLLVETHSWKPYRTRVEVSRDIILSAVEQASARGKDWLALAQAADAESQKLAGKPVTLTYETTKKQTPIDFPGVAYRHEYSPISDSQALIYDPTQTKNWRVPFRNEVRPKLVLPAPKEGYIIPAAYARQMSELLKIHGIEHQSIPNAHRDLPVGLFRASKVKQASRSFEGRQRCDVQGAWSEAKVDLPPNCLYIPIAQEKARLVMALLEPQAPDSLTAWGFFNAHFEQKEYMERYVAEQVGQKMLAEDPQLAKKFQQKLDTDPEFAKNPRARLNFFYKRHPSWDDRRDLVPLYRLEAPLR